MRLTEEQYIEVQTQLAALGAIVRDMPLQEFIEDAAQAGTLGAVLDPTLFRKGQAPLQTVMHHARALREFQRVIRGEPRMR